MKAKPRVFLESRYRKLERGLPQTTYYCPTCRGRRRRREGCPTCAGRGRLTDDSVQQLLARRILPAFGSRFGKFHGAGREDVDVLMLGRGRPFVYEIEKPQLEDVDLEALRAQIHAEVGERVQLTEPLRRVERRRVGEIKEAHWSKRYRLGVAVPGEVEAGVLAALPGRRLLVHQRTPTRVVHRRADLVRERRVEVLAVRSPAEGPPLELDIETTHGTYVKEWVSGDEGRSTPSLSELVGVPATCERLDVLEILDEVAAGAGGDCEASTGAVTRRP